MIAFLLGAAELAEASAQLPSATLQAPAAPSKAHIVREFDRMEGGGATLILFNIDKSGKAFGCTVLEPSGSAYLDEEACRTAGNRKFRPTLNDKGKPVPTYGKMLRIRWNIQE